MSAIPDLLTWDNLPWDLYEQTDLDMINGWHRERMAEVIKERDDLKLVLDRQNPWNEKAQELLDASRWAGHTLIEGCATELEETRAERDDAREQLSRICRELFDNDDTIGGESAADYVIRQVTKEREELRQVKSDLREARNWITLLQMDLDVASCLAEEHKQAREENAKLRKAIWKVLNIIPTPTCDQMHHAKKEQHEYGSICPPVERVKAIIDNCKKLLE